MAVKIGNVVYFFPIKVVEQSTWVSVVSWVFKKIFKVNQYILFLLIVCVTLVLLTVLNSITYTIFVKYV